MHSLLVNFFNLNHKDHNLILNPFSWPKHFVERANVNTLEVFDKCEEILLSLTRQMNVTMFKFDKKLMRKSLGANLILKKLLKEDNF